MRHQIVSGCAWLRRTVLSRCVGWCVRDNKKSRSIPVRSCLAGGRWGGASSRGCGFYAAGGESEKNVRLPIIVRQRYQPDKIGVCERGVPNIPYEGTRIQSMHALNVQKNCLYIHYPFRPPPNKNSLVWYPVCVGVIQYTSNPHWSGSSSYLLKRYPSCTKLFQLTCH